MNHYVAADALELVHSGSDFFDRLIRLIDEARECLHLQTYIYRADETGRTVAEALKRATARGVRVFMLVDEYGSGQLPPDFVQELKASGIAFRVFDHLISFSQWSFGRTLHHKVVVADGRAALVGGINIADKYRGGPDTPPWLDFAVEIHGGICGALQDLCTRIFEQRYWKKQPGPVSPQAVGKHLKGLVRIRQNDWMRRKTEIYRSYRQNIIGARQTLYLTASYFLPGRSLRGHLKAAVRRGVSVRILLTGPSDVPLSQLAEQYLSEWLLKAGVRVFRWEKSVMHGKSILVDGQWASIGSYNINRLSRFRSVELNVDVLDPEFVQHFQHWLETLLAHQCTELTLDGIPFFSSRWARWKARLAYHFSVYLMRVLFPERRVLSG